MENPVPGDPEVFISYASGDLERAEALYARLVATGVKVWFDKARLDPGCDWHKEIESGCEAARVVLPLLTPRWKLSTWTRFETYGHAAILPLHAEGDPSEVFTPPLRRWQGPAFDPLTACGEAWQKLFAAVRAKLLEPAPEKATRIADLPHPANPFFTGREADLVRIHEELHEGPVAALTQGRVRALAAMGGIGKTTLANEYVRRFWRLYPQILWINARLGYEIGFARLFDRLFPDLAHVPIQPADKAQRVLNELNGRAERLLVLDNVEDVESVRPWLPQEALSGCRTLITSRFAKWPQEEGIRTVQLDVLEPASARQFLTARTGRTAEGAELAACDALAGTLGYLPLALEQAAAFIDAQKKTFADYLRLYAEAAETLLSRRALGSTDYPDAVITAWQITVKKFSPLARGLLRLASCVADTPIPTALFRTNAAKVFAFAQAFGPVHPPASETDAEIRLGDALAEELHLYSMVLDWIGESFRVHGLVQAVEWIRSTQQEREQVLSVIYDLITDYGPSPAFEPSNFGVWNGLFPHAVASYQHGALCPTMRPPLELLRRLDEYSFGRGNFAQSAKYSEERLAHIEREHGPQSEEVADALVYYGESLRELGQKNRARDCFQRSVSIRRLGAPSVELATSINYLAMTLDNLAEWEAACREGLALCELVGQPECATAVKLNINLGAALYRQGKLAESEIVARHALAISERIFGPHNPHTLRMIDNLAVVLGAMGDVGAAEPLHRRALKEREEFLGPEHPDTLISVKSLAECIKALGDAAGALPLYRRALEGSERVRGAEHPHTLIFANVLGTCLQTLGDAAGALPLYRRALENSARVLGDEHPLTITFASNLAGCLQDKGDLAAAEPLYRRALEAQERVLGPEHPHTLTSVNNLASCLDSLARPVEAAALHRRAVEAQIRKLGPEHPEC